MTKIMHLILIASATAVFGTGLTSCSTISQEQCLARNMEDVGFKDGRNGASRDRFSRLSKSCAKHDVSLDRAAYLRGFERGLPLFCTYENGFSRGQSGGRVNRECSAINSSSYVSGYQDGAEIYEIESGHKGLIASYEESVAQLADIRRSLENDELTKDELKHLLKKEIRLEDQREEIRYEIREYENLYGLARYNFAY